MLRSAPRAVIRSAQSSLAPARTGLGRRFASTQPAYLQRRSWKSSTFRWGIAIIGLYYYNTSPVFAEEPHNNLLNPNLEVLEDSGSPTLDSLTSRKGREQKQPSVLESAVKATSTENASTTAMEQSPTPTVDGISSPQDLEEEAAGEGAFNPVTGEINWDCPCLGGMAHGPCGAEFREAFSCFVYSTDEPKGMECIEKFKGMQDCFQKYPEIYRGELDEDQEDELDAGLEAERQELVREIKERQDARKEAGAPEKRLLEELPAPNTTTVTRKSTLTAPDPHPQPQTPQPRSSTSEYPKINTQTAALEPQNDVQRLPKSRKPINEGQNSGVQRAPNLPKGDGSALPEADELVPKAAHDARDAKTEN